MPQEINQHISRKLSKQRHQNVGLQQDFIAERCAEIILERMAQVNRLPVQENIKALILYERNSGMLQGLGGMVQLIDQVPFTRIKTSPAQIMAMLPARQYDVVISNLVFDWLDAGLFIRLLEYLLKPDGMFWFSCYGPLTAEHTRSMLSEVDRYPHFNEFYDMRDVGDALLGAGFKDVVLESSMVNLEYDSADALLADAVRVFAVNAHPNRRKSLTPGGVLIEFKKQLEKEIQSNGKFTEQVEILIAHGKKPCIPGLSGVIPVRQE